MAMVVVLRGACACAAYKPHPITNGQATASNKKLAVDAITFKINAVALCFEITHLERGS